CNNNGHCRKFDAGTMCPSFRVTGDEMHLTRGRANTLRLALSGQLGDEGEEAVKSALDLCVSCKGCKRECPTGVDMARMKIEFLAGYRRRHGLTTRERMVAYLPRYAPWAGRMAPLANSASALLKLALGFRDEFCAMLPGSEVLARHAFLFEEFIVRELDAGHFSASFTPLAKKALLHGHCHQKAFDAMPAVMRVLKLIPELRIEAVESS